MEDRNADQSNTLLSDFLSVLNSVSSVGANPVSLGRVPLNNPDKMVREHMPSST